MVQKMFGGYARQRMGPKSVNCCKPQQVCTKEYGKMLKRIQVLEEGRIHTLEARDWKIEGQKREELRAKGIRGFLCLKWKVSWRKKDCGISSEKRCCRTAREEGGIARECKAVHEERFLSSWLREDVEGIEERRTEWKRLKRRKAEVVKERWRERWTERRRKRLLLSEGVSTSFPVTFFEEFGPVDDSGSFGDILGTTFSVILVVFSECVLAVSSGVPVVIDVSVSSPSVGLLGGFSLLTLLVRV